jgi:hypothetical protein
LGLEHLFSICVRSNVLWNWPELGVKHRNVEYSVAEVEPGKWRWIIEAGKAIGPPKFRSREAAVAAGIEEINNAIERGKRAPRSVRPPA